MNDNDSTISAPRPSWPTNALNDCTQIDREANSLIYLADSFEHVGNDTLAERLRETARELRHRTANIRNDIGDAVNQRFKDSMESSGNLLAAVLAGTVIARNEDAS